MKIQCDACNKEEASVFCSADEAALCDRCDRRVHHANKLAEKHARFDLLHPTSVDSPCCDICQERRAFLFCREDRTVLCRECDISIHTANEHTKKHNRFLLTGVKLSASSSLYSNSTLSGSSITYPRVCDPNLDVRHDQTSSISTSNTISEYLETLPGWHVEELLDDPSSLNSFCFCKTTDQSVECVRSSFSSKANSTN